MSRRRFRFVGMLKCVTHSEQSILLYDSGSFGHNRIVFHVSWLLNANLRRNDTKWKLIGCAIFRQTGCAQSANQKRSFTRIENSICVRADGVNMALLMSQRRGQRIRRFDFGLFFHIPLLEMKQTAKENSKNKRKRVILTKEKINLMKILKKKIVARFSTTTNSCLWCSLLFSNSQR